VSGDAAPVPPPAGGGDVIVLIGYRGCGKSSVARALAVQLGWRHVDTDDRIEERAGCSVAQLFARDGESAFRRLESAVIGELPGASAMVVSVGGGAILDPANRDVLRRLGRCVWLTAGVDVILARLAADARSASLRPALTDASPADEVRTVLAVRSPLYAELASFTIDTTGRSVADVADEVLQRWRRAGGSGRVS
jgi:shikimate kinase